MVPGYCSSKGEDLERAGQSKIGGEKKERKNPKGVEMIQAKKTKNEWTRLVWRWFDFPKLLANWEGSQKHNKERLAWEGMHQLKATFMETESLSSKMES